MWNRPEVEGSGRVHVDEFGLNGIGARILKTIIEKF